MSAVSSPPAPGDLRGALLRAPRGSSPPRLVSIGLLGHGRVGRALCELLAARGGDIARRHGLDLRIATVLVRDATAPRDSLPPAARLSGCAESFLAGEHDGVVEVLGGLEPAGTLVAALLARGTPVVTANKLLLAERGLALASAAAASGAALRYEASVAAGVPLFSVIERSLRTTRISGIAAVLNGTSNFVLSRIARGGASFGDALAEAQRLGLAEPDATLDVRGADAAHKLRVLALAACGRELPARRVDVRGIESVRAPDCARAALLGHRIKPVAWADLSGPPDGWVAPAAVPEGHPLAAVEGAQSGVLLTGDTVADLFLAGPGAGPTPTAASIVDDLIAVATGGAAPPLASESPAETPFPETPPSRSRWLLAFAPTRDRPGTEEVLAFLAREGIAFRQLREIDEPAGHVVAGVTCDAASESVGRAGATLRTVGAVREWSAFRVLPSSRPVA